MTKTTFNEDFLQFIKQTHQYLPLKVLCELYVDLSIYLSMSVEHMEEHTTEYLHLILDTLILVLKQCNTLEEDNSDDSESDNTDTIDSGYESENEADDDTKTVDVFYDKMCNMKFKKLKNGELTVEPIHKKTNKKQDYVEETPEQRYEKEKKLAMEYEQRLKNIYETYENLCDKSF